MAAQGGPAQRSEEWFSIRGNRVTGSIIDAIIEGKSAYTSRDRLCLEKAGMPSVFKGSIATRHGTKLEEVAIKLYEKRTGHIVLPMPLIQHPDHPLLAHSPDGIILRKDKPPLLLEVKAPFKRDFENDTEVYSSYVHQVQMGINVFDTAGAHFVQYRPEGHMGKPELMTIIEVERDVLWLEKYGPTVESFWADVEHWRKEGWTNHPLAAKLRPKPPPPCGFKDDDDEETAHTITHEHKKPKTSTCLFNDDDDE